MTAEKATPPSFDDAFWQDVFRRAERIRNLPVSVLAPRPGGGASSPLTPAELAVLRRRVLLAMLSRHYALADAEDLAQEVVAKVTANPQRFAEQARDLDHHAAYFVQMAHNDYLMKLRSQRRREERETKWWRDLPVPVAFETSQGADVLAMLDKAPLSRLQKDYVRKVLAQHRSIAQIAEETRTSPRAVRAVLERAAKTLRTYITNLPEY